MSYAQAVEFYLDGKNTKSLALCQKILKKNQKDDKALNLYGLIQGSLGNKSQAILFFQRAIAANPQNVEAITNLANAYNVGGQKEEAIKYYQLAIKSNPLFAKSYYNASILLKEIGAMEDAKQLLLKAVELDPLHIDTYVNLSSIYKELQEPDEAILVLQKCPEKDERIFSLLALLYAQKKQFEHSNEAILQALRICKNEKTLNDYGLILASQKRYEEAIVSYAEALSYKNDFDAVYLNMSNVFAELGDVQKAKGALLKAISINPAAASNYVNLGVCLKNEGNMQDAENLFIKALELEPNNRPASTNLGILRMYLGDYENGLSLYETREKPLIRANIPLWREEDLSGKKLLVYSEQGLGDSINFARLLNGLVCGDCEVYFMPQKELYSVFKSSKLNANVISQDELGSISFDYHIPLLSLMRICGVNSAEIPKNIEYIVVDKNKKDFFNNKLSSEAKKIGIVWQGNRAYSGDKRRSIPLDSLQRLFDLKNTLIVSLQIEIDEDSKKLLTEKSNAIEFSSELHDFSDTAALISTLDYVISVDTSVAHLAGVLNKPVSILLPYVCDWRWGWQGNLTPWYESARLYRQKTLDGWDSALDELIGDFEKVLG